MKFSFKVIVCIIVLSAILFCDFFYVNNYAAYPWWHQKGNDIDGAYSATTAGLLNNTELDFVYHPGATVYTIHGAVYRVLNLADLSGIKDINGAVEVLDKLVRTSRIVAVLLGVIFAAVFFSFFCVLSGHILLSFLIAFYALSSPAFLEHIYMIRAEMPNLIFFFGALLVLFVNLREREIPPWKFIRIMAITGLLIGLSILSKIQIGPAVLACVAGTALYLFLNERYGKALLAHPKAVWICLVLSLLNCVVMPWWALNRPAFLNAEYFRILHKDAALRYVYGLAPESFLPPILILFLMLAGLSAGLLFWRSSAKREDLLQRIFPGILSIHCLILGAIGSVYLVLLPASVSFSKYIDNTQHLVYSVLTNVIYGKFLTNRVLDGGTFVKIFDMHSSRSLLLGVNILILVGIVAVGCAVRVLPRSTKDKLPYLLALAFIATGLTLDILATMHWKNVRLYHAIYSVCFYSAGLLVWLNFEVQKRGARIAVWTVLGLHCLIVSVHMFQQPRASGVSDQDPAVEFLNVKTLAQPFWRAVDENIQRNSAHAQ